MRHLIPILVFLTGCASPAAPHPDEDPHTLTLTDEQLQQCMEQRGCVVISREKVLELMREVRDEAMKGCGDMHHSETFNPKGMT